MEYMLSYKATEGLPRGKNLKQCSNVCKKLSSKCGGSISMTIYVTFT